MDIFKTRRVREGVFINVPHYHAECSLLLFYEKKRKIRKITIIISYHYLQHFLLFDEKENKSKLKKAWGNHGFYDTKRKSLKTSKKTMFIKYCFLQSEWPSGRKEEKRRKSRTATPRVNNGTK